MHITEDKNQKENKVLSFFKGIGKELTSRPQSLIRGIAATAAFGGMMYYTQVNGEIASDIRHITPYLFTSLSLMWGMMANLDHRKKENLNVLRKQAYPQNKIKNFLNSAWETTVTGAYALTGIAGIAGAANTGIVNTETLVTATSAASIALVLPVFGRFMTYREVNTDFKTSDAKYAIKQRQATEGLKVA